MSIKYVVAGLTLGVLVAGGVVACSPEAKGSPKVATYCDGDDKVFLWDSHKEAALFVIKDHRDC